MPVYDFQDPLTGELFELYFTVNDAPSIGESVEHKGQRLVRCVTSPMTKKPSTQEPFRLVSEAAPLRHDIERAIRAGDEVVHAPAYDEQGRALFKSEKEVQDFCDRSGGKYVWGKQYHGVADGIAEQQKAARATQEAEIAKRERQMKAPLVG